MKVLIIILSVLWFSPSFSQTITGWIVDADTKNPLEFSNIGILKKRTGTVSDSRGFFSLNLSPEYNKDTLRISVVGYQSASFVVEQLKRVFQTTKNDLVIELTRKIPILPQVVISPTEFVRKNVGNRNIIKLFTAEFTGNDSLLTSEVGTVMKIKKSPACIRDVNFIIDNIKYPDSLFLRINIYTLKNGRPDENVLMTPISVSAVKNGTLSVNIEKYNICVYDDFFVSLEWTGRKETISFFCRFSKNKTYMRVGQGEWDKLPLMALSFYSTVLYPRK